MAEPRHPDPPPDVPPPLLEPDPVEEPATEPEQPEPGQGKTPAPLTITIPRFWSRPQRRTPHGRRSSRPALPSGLPIPTKRSHRIGILATALVAASAIALTVDGSTTLTTDGSTTRTELDSHTSANGPTATPPRQPADPAPSVQPLTLAAADPFNPNAGAGAPTVSIPGVGAPTGAAVPTVQPVVLPAAAPAAPLPATPKVGQSAVPRALSTSGIPTRAKTAYTGAATRMAALAPTCRLPWTLLAAIGRVESNHARANGSALIASTGRVSPAIYGVRLDGTTRGTSVVRDTDRGSLDSDATYDRAVGPMQFLPATWRTFGADADGDGAANPQDLDDAALAAGRYLCTGATGTKNLATQAGQWNAAYRYNHSTSYANLVLALATTYATGRPATVVNPPGATTTLPTVTITITPTTASQTTHPTPTPTTSVVPTTVTTTATSTAGTDEATTVTVTSAPTTTNPGTVTVTVTVVTVTVTGQAS